MPRINSTLEERFWSKVDTSGDCWVWTASNVDGYGLMSVGVQSKSMTVATHVSWYLAHGYFPDGLQVLHRCDNPPCVRIDHLFLGTQSDNMRDMVAKGRHRNQNTGKTHCIHGHEFTPENTYLPRYRRDTGRECRTCNRIRVAARRNR